MVEEKTTKLPEAGRCPDKLVPPAIVAGALLTTVGFLAAFFVVTPVGGAAVGGVELVGGVAVSSKLLLSQKIFFFHMPVALVSFVALAFAAYYSARFLKTRVERFDTCARVAMEVALLFVVMTMLTGEMWTRFEWGVWWTWDPRLTTYLVLMLIVIAYLALRSMVDDPERRAAFSAVVAIAAFVDAPICLMVTRLVPSSVHPVVVRQGSLAPDMAITVGAVLLGMLCVAFVLYRLRLRQLLLEQRIDALKESLDNE